MIVGSGHLYLVSFHVTDPGVTSFSGNAGIASWDGLEIRAGVAADMQYVFIRLLLRGHQTFGLLLVSMFVEFPFLFCGAKDNVHIDTQRCSRR